MMNHPRPLVRPFVLTPLAVAFVAAVTISSADAGTGQFAGNPADVASPLTVDVDSRHHAQAGRQTMAAVPLVFDAEAYADLEGRSQIAIERFPLAPLARGEQMLHVPLELRRIKSVTDSTQVVVAHVIDGEIVEQPIDRPDVQMFAGKVVGDDASIVFLSFSPHGSHGYIRAYGVTQLISPGPFGEGRTPLIYNLDAVQAGMIQWRDFVCNAKSQQGAEWGGEWPENAGGIPTSEPPCRRVEVAIETDKEFTDNLFGSDPEAAAAYVATLLGASSEIFERDVNAEMEVVFVRLWQGSDPWTGSNTTQQLFEFRDYWNANMGHVDRHLAHYLSGRPLGGGVAWLNAICHPTNSYALSANLNGFFPYPMQNNHSQNWDIFVVAHEFGHNFGTPHTHDFCPPLDECPPSQWFGQCQSQQNCTNQGTIMSYCHLCSGGMTNIVLEFHPVVKQTIINYLNTVTDCYIGCLPQQEIIHVPDDTPSIQEAIMAVLPGGEVIVSPGVYNEAINTGGKAMHVYSTDGPEVTIIDATGRNASAARFSNGESSQTILEGFTLTGGTGSNVTIGGTQYVLGGGVYAGGSSPIVRNCIIIDNTAQFGGGVFNNNASPTFENCIFDSNASSPSSGGGAFNFNGAAPHFIDTDFVNNTAAANGGGMSNQGASPIVTNASFENNSASGEGGAVRNIQSSAGQFTNCTFRSNSAGDGGAFFNNQSGNTLIGDSTFCENTPNNITGSYTDGGGNEFLDECPPECKVGDLNCDGVVDGADLGILLANWGDCPECADCPADLNGDCQVDGADLGILLANWG